MLLRRRRLRLELARRTVKVEERGRLRSLVVYDGVADGRESGLLLGLGWWWRWWRLSWPWLRPYWGRVSGGRVILGDCREVGEGCEGEVIGEACPRWRLWLWKWPRGESSWRRWRWTCGWRRRRSGRWRWWPGTWWADGPLGHWDLLFSGEGREVGEGSEGDVLLFLHPDA